MNGRQRSIRGGPTGALRRLLPIAALAPVLAMANIPTIPLHELVTDGERDARTARRDEAEGDRAEPAPSRSARRDAPLRRECGAATPVPEVGARLRP